MNRAIPLAARATLIAIVVAVGGLALLTHVVAPLLFRHYEHNPAFARVPTRTHDRSGDPADPVNIALVGTTAEVREAFAKAGWAQADSLSRRADLAIAKSVLLRRPDSPRQCHPSISFVAARTWPSRKRLGSASRRHHVRLWLADGVTDQGRPVWIGDATYNVRAGISHRTLAPTHHIEADVDRERDTLMADLATAGQLSERYAVTGMGPRVDAHNASGDRFNTDGELDVGVIAAANTTTGPPVVLPDPPLIRWKNAVWSSFRRHL